MDQCISLILLIGCVKMISSNCKLVSHNQGMVCVPRSYQEAVDLCINHSLRMPWPANDPLVTKLIHLYNLSSAWVPMKRRSGDGWRWTDGTNSSGKGRGNKSNPHAYRLSCISEDAVSILKLLIPDHVTPDYKTCVPLCERPFGHLFAEDAYHGNSCYEFRPSPLVTYMEAKEACAQNQSTLVSIETEKELLHLRRVTQRNPWLGVPAKTFPLDRLDGYWTSGSNEKEEGHWIWEATGQPITYVNWKRDEPNNLFWEEHYLVLTMFDYKWIDTTKTFISAVICEKRTMCA